MQRTEAWVGWQMSPLTFKLLWADDWSIHGWYRSSKDTETQSERGKHVKEGEIKSIQACGHIWWDFELYKGSRATSVLQRSCWLTTLTWKLENWMWIFSSGDKDTLSFMISLKGNSLSLIQGRRWSHVVTDQCAQRVLSLASDITDREQHPTTRGRSRCALQLKEQTFLLLHFTTLNQLKQTNKKTNDGQTPQPVLLCRKEKKPANQALTWSWAESACHKPTYTTNVWTRFMPVWF